LTEELYLEEMYCYNCISYDKNKQYCNERKETIKEPIHCSLFNATTETDKQPKIFHTYPQNQIQQLKTDLYEIFMDKHPDLNAASELITICFMNNNKVYAIRDDKSDELWVYHKGIYLPDGMTYIREFCIGILGKRYTGTFANKIISKIQTDNYINKEEFFKIDDPYEIPVKNGILNVMTGYLSKFTPDRIFFSKLDMNYNPEVRIDYINKFLHEILIKEDVKIIQELLGYLLIKKYPIQKAFMFLGSGSNGKSALLELMKRFIGDKNCSNISLDELQNNQYASSELFNKFVNIAGDISNRIRRYKPV